jgi:hypothetical protein
MSCSTSLADAPGSVVVTTPIGIMIAGSASFGIVMTEYIPARISTIIKRIVKCSFLRKNFQKPVMVY